MAGHDYDTEASHQSLCTLVAINRFEWFRYKK
jgi:hypothetical protein